MNQQLSDWLTTWPNLWLNDTARYIGTAGILALATALVRWWGRDTPRIVWSNGQFNQENLFQDPHTQRLAWLLHYSQPELLQRWYEVVLRSAIRAQTEEAKLLDFCTRRDELTAKAASDRAACHHIAQQVQELPTKAQAETGFAIGLSFMLFLGIAEYLGIDIQSVTSDKFLLVGLAIAAAICLTIAAKKAIVRWVKATRSHEPRRSYPDDQRHANTIPFWARLIQGDAAIWLTILVVLFEMLFAAPGLIGFLPPRLAAQPIFQISAFAAAGLAALINAFLAWGAALDAIRWEQEQPQPPPFALESTQLDYVQRSASSQAALQTLRQQIDRQRAVTRDTQKAAQQEHQRWERSVRKWLRQHPSKLERFDQIYPEIEASTQQLVSQERTWPSAQPDETQADSNTLAQQR